MERRGFLKSLLASILIVFGFRNNNHVWVETHKVSVFPKSHGTPGMKWVTGFDDGKNVGFEGRETGIVSNHPNYKAEYHYDPNTTVGWVTYYKKAQAA